MLTVKPRDQLHMTNSRNKPGPWSRKHATRSRKPEFSRPTLTSLLARRGSAGQQWSATADHAMLPQKEHGELYHALSLHVRQMHDALANAIRCWTCKHDQAIQYQRPTSIMKVGTETWTLLYEASRPLWQRAAPVQSTQVPLALRRLAWTLTRRGASSWHTPSRGASLPKPRRPRGGADLCG